MIIWMAVIFMFSAKTADESTKDSYKVGMKLGEIFVPAFRQKSEDEKLAFAKKADHPVRKTAHALEYALLGVLATGVFAGSGARKEDCKSDSVKPQMSKQSIPYITAWAVSTAYAMTDELHQLFVAGRSGQLSDVCLDSAGALVGIFVAAVVGGYVRKSKKPRKDRAFEKNHS